MNTSDKFFWIINHTGFGVPKSQAEIELTPQMVNPLTNSIDENRSLNTKQEWWVELSKLTDLGDNDIQSAHYWELDCGGDTADSAIDKLYEIVLKQYGEY
jgi:hypothetical protein